jgi:iron complex transport system ATP-binding protein
MTVLAAEKLTVRRAGRAIVRDISLSARAGEFIAVIGPNGAGKSTLLSVLAGLVRPDAGQVTLDGRLLRTLSARELAARRAWLPQNPLVEWPISVERLVALGLTPRLPATGGLPDAFTPAIDRVLALCDLEERRTQPATTLSGGELARAMLARALVGDPAILIVDEPTAGLDPRHAMDCMGLLEGQAAAGKLVIAALHDLTLAARHASRVVVLVDGGLIADSDSLTEELIHRAFGVGARATGAGDSRAFTLLPTREKSAL